MSRSRRKGRKSLEPKASSSPKTANRALAVQTRKALLKHYRKRYRVFSR